jgi:transposase-like protein
VQTEDGQFELNTPRDRNGEFEPQLVKQHQRRFTTMDDKILFLYAQGMSTREIVTAFKELYGADVSPTLISKVTDAVIEQVTEWQARPLDASANYVDTNHAAYIATGVWHHYLASGDETQLRVLWPCVARPRLRLRATKQ